MIASILTSTLFMAGEVKASAAQVTPVVAARPWYVKAASDQIVNMCFWGGMWGGMSGGGYTTAGNGGAVSSIVFSSIYTESYETDTATTLYTTIPGGVVTVYGSADATPVVSTLDDSVVATATDDVTATDAAASVAATTPTTTAAPVANGLVAEVRALESYAHLIAEAIVSPSSMTAMLEDAYNAIMHNGFIHGDMAVRLVSQASGAYKQLQTAPALSKERQALKHQPTPAHFNVKNVVSTLTHTHAAGLAKMTSVPEGKQAYHEAKHLAEAFVKEFVH